MFFNLRVTSRKQVSCYLFKEYQIKLKKITMTETNMTTIPKPAKSGYLHFIEEQRANPKVVEGLKSTEIIKKLGADWKALDEASKQKYEEIAKQDKVRYTAEKESWLKEHPGQEFPKKEKKEKKEKKDDKKEEDVEELKVEDTPKDDGKEKKKKSSKKEKAETAPVIEQEAVMIEVEVEPETPAAPKKKPNKFINFCKEKRQEVKKSDPTKSVTEITTALAGMWKSLTEEEKQKYA